MPEHVTQRSTAVLYEHPLLGEGIARILLRETTAQVAAVPAADVRAVEAALSLRPDVVIVEGRRCRPWCEALAPHAILIDVTPAMTAERIVGVVRGGEMV